MRSQPLPVVLSGLAAPVLQLGAILVVQADDMDLHQLETGKQLGHLGLVLLDDSGGSEISSLAGSLLRIHRLLGGAKAPKSTWPGSSSAALNSMLWPHTV
jgi:hypothetical protein